MPKALFLDRDGVLNRELGDYVCHPSQFEVLPEVAAALRKAKEQGYRLIVVSNQGGVALGRYGFDELRGMEAILQVALSGSGVSIDAFYYCPHHPTVGRCLCRKPAPLLLEKAIVRFGIQPAGSIMVGDNGRDIAAAEAAGVRGILMPSNGSLLEALRPILG